MNFKSKKTFWLFLCSYLSILLIPILILTAFWGPRMQQNAQKESKVRIQNNLTLAAEQLEQQINAIYSLPDQIYKHPRIILSSIMDSPIQIKNAKSDLAMLISGNTFIDFTMLYLREYDYFLSARAASFYFSDLGKYPGLFQLTFGSMPLHEMYEQLENTDSTHIFLSSSVQINSNAYKDVLLFFLPFPSSKQSIGTCVVGVTAAQIDKMIKPITANGSLFLLMDEHSNAIYCSDHSLHEQLQSNLLPLNAADAAESKSVQLMDMEYVVNSITSSRTGLRYISLTSMDGILQNTYLVQKSMLLILLVVLVFSTFAIYFAMRMNYAPLKQLSSFAIAHASGSEYSKNDFDQIQQLITKLYTENQKLDHKLTASDTQMHMMIFVRLLYGNAHEVKRTMENAQALHIELGEKCWQVLLAEYDSEEAAENAAVAVPDEANLFALKLDKNTQIVYIRHSIENETVPEKLIQQLGNPLQLVISELTSELENLNSVYLSAYAAQDYLHASEKPISLFYCSSLQDRFYNPRFYPLDVMQALETTIKYGDVKKLNELMTQIVALLAVEGAPPYYTRSIYYNTVSLLINGLSGASSKNDDLIAELSTRSLLPRYTIREMVAILRSTTEKLTAVLEDKEVSNNHSLWMDVLNLIDQNLSSPNFCLQEIADQMGMAASTFSRAFKENVGKTFKEYVDELRILRARDMLANSDMPIEAVALQVGYENITSFYRFFKKYTSLAPGVYRAAVQQNEKNENE